MSEKNRKPKISIIIPTLNEEKWIGRTFKNLKKIKSIPYEIIVSDGNSKDKTISIAKRYTKKYVVYKEKKRQNIAMGRNMGARIARGEYFVFMDADVTIPDVDNFFKKAISFFDKIETKSKII